MWNINKVTDARPLPYPSALVDPRDTNTMMSGKTEQIGETSTLISKSKYFT